MRDGFRYRDMRIAVWLYEQESPAPPRKMGRSAAAIKWHMERVEDELDEFIAKLGPGRRTAREKRIVKAMREDIRGRRAKMEFAQARAAQVDAEARNARIGEILHMVRMGAYPLDKVAEANEAIVHKPRFDRAFPRIGDDE